MQTCDSNHAAKDQFVITPLTLAQSWQTTPSPVLMTSEVKRGCRGYEWGDGLGYVLDWFRLAIFWTLFLYTPTPPLPPGSEVRGGGGYEMGAAMLLDSFWYTPRLSAWLGHRGWVSCIHTHALQTRLVGLWLRSNRATEKAAPFETHGRCH